MSVILVGILVSANDGECALDTQFGATNRPTIHLHQERRVTNLQCDKNVTLLTSLYGDNEERIFMDYDTARTRLNDEKTQLHGLLDETTDAARDDRVGANEPGDMQDSEPSLTLEAQDDAVVEGLRERLAAVERALQRLSDGTYGRSTFSGDAIPDARLEADPAAELTADEALER
jgi:DnaK suppressor protein